MNERFKRYVDSLDPSLQRLIDKPPLKVEELPHSMPRSGIYLLSEGAEHLYVGRSSRLRSRIRGHSRESGTHRQAAFAFLLARHATGRTEASYKPEGSRSDLMTDPEFVEAFVDAKQRISRMDVRYVEETHPLRQALLEMYVAVALETPFNDFDTH